MLHGEVVVRVVARLPGFRCFVSGAAVHHEARVLLWRSLGLHKGPEAGRIQALPLRKGDACGEVVVDGAEAAAKALNAIVGVAIFTDDVPHDGTTCADYGLRIQLVRHSKARPKRILARIQQNRAFVGRKFQGPQNIVGRGIRYCRIEVAVLQACFAPGSTQVVAQARIDAQLAGQLEIVLHITGVVLVPVINVCAEVERPAARQA